MAAPFGIPVILAAMVAALKADATLGAIITDLPVGFGTGNAVYAANAVPPGATFPYVTVGAPTEVPFNNMGPGAGGSNCTVLVKAFSTKPNDDELYRIGGAVTSVLDAATLTVTGYATAECELDSVPDVFQEQILGIGIVRQLPMIYRVYVHQTA
jgi:Protein of unknown function (DUF3168)